MRHSAGSDASFSLFPFLSILVCLMGILGFIMVSIISASALNPAVKIELQGTHTKQPVFVECRQGRAVIEPEGTTVPLADLGNQDSAFQQLIARLAANNQRQYLIFAVFPDGLECFEAARGAVEVWNARSPSDSDDIDIGFEPMLQDWQVEWGDGSIEDGASLARRGES